MQRRPDLVAWQWSLYPEGHRDRRNLAIHLVTQPLFAAGIASIVLALPLWQPLLAACGLVSAVVAIALQGRGHARETTPPVPFLGPLDVVSRILLEQLVTWPRFVLSGGFARAWRDAR